MPGPDPKPPERRQRRNKRWGPKLVREVHQGEPPEAPRGLLKTTRELWDGFWSSVLVEEVVQPVDLPAIRRLFALYDERERAYRAYRNERLVEGSQGQPVLHPLARQIPKYDSEIRQLEKEFGLTPKARAKLGISFTEAKRRLSDLNRDLEVDPDADPREEIEIESA